MKKKLMLHPNKNDIEDKMTKKIIKELKMILSVTWDARRAEDLCWSMKIVSILKKRGVGNVIMSHESNVIMLYGMQGM